MRFIQPVLVFLFLSVLSYGKAHAFIPSGPEKSSKEQVHTVSHEKYSENRGDENSGLKRKIKPRGVEVAVPQITSLEFEQICTYRAFLPSVIRNTYTSFLYCVHRKRGPPLS